MDLLFGGSVATSCSWLACRRGGMVIASPSLATALLSVRYIRTLKTLAGHIVMTRYDRPSLAEPIVHSLWSCRPYHLWHTVTYELKSLFILLFDLVDLFRHACNVSADNNASKKLARVFVT